MQISDAISNHSLLKRRKASAEKFVIIDFCYKITFRGFLSEIRFANNLHERFFPHFLSFGELFSSCSLSIFPLTNIYFKLEKFSFPFFEDHKFLSCFTSSTKYTNKNKIFTFSSIYRNFACSSSKQKQHGNFERGLSFHVFRKRSQFSLFSGGVERSSLRPCYTCMSFFQAFRVRL